MLTHFLAQVESLGFEVNIQENGNIRIFSECCPSWKISLWKTNEDIYLPVIYFRTKRIEEVTDLHDIIPAIFAGIVKLIGGCSFRFLGEHNDFSGIDDELYGMYIFPSQPFSERIRSKYEEDLQRLGNLLVIFIAYTEEKGDILGYISGKPEDFSYQSVELDNWKAQIISVFKGKISYISSIRKNPDWLYFRSFSEKFSITKSHHIAKQIKKFYSIKKQRITYVQGPEGKIEVFGDLNHIIRYQDEELPREIFNSLDDKTEIIVVAQENQLLFVSDFHLLIKYSDSGLSAVAEEKRLILERQEREITLLFGSKKIKWRIKDKSDSSIFEDLILELLNREPYILSVKKVAPTNQPDNGRDLICEYNMLYKERKVEKSNEIIEVGQMIVQCKTNLCDSKRQSIGKSDVDIANTIFDYRPDGYMLVVNTQITRDLTEMLERQKERKEQNTVLWWNSFDVEERLRKNPDILARYKSIVGFG